ncbi:Acg family FMN-binding oxidoreductase [Nocardia stercoris]|uniref:Acg family FMN-binding oxidoreductase n=1 Tax=Nocardia stercoris TaxID=2483361 RepID=UPI003898E1CF
MLIPEPRSTAPSSRSAAPDRRTLLAVFRLATRAPSLHNTQPWRWVADGAHLDLFADIDRLLRAADPQGRQELISCGVVLHHAVTALAAHGWRAEIDYFPDACDPDHLAALSLRQTAGASAADVELARAMDERYSDRLPMLPPHGLEQLVPRLRAAVSAYELDFDVLPEAGRARLAALSDRHAADRDNDALYQQELSGWAGHADAPEGVPPSSLVSAAEFARTDVGRAFPAAPHAQRRAGLSDRAEVAVISSYGDSPLQWLFTGAALSAVLLECTVAGLSTCPLTHITETTADRRALAMLLPQPAPLPQALVRIGTAPDDDRPPPSPRRPLVDVVEFRS